MDCLAASMVINKFKVPAFNGHWDRTGLGATYSVCSINLVWVSAQDKLMPAAQEEGFLPYTSSKVQLLLLGRVLWGQC